MKSERKQILESNLLADKIEQHALQLKKAMPLILAVTAVVVVALLAYGFYTSVQEKESAKAWTALYFADTDAKDLTAISSDFGGTTAGLWAKQTSGDANMSRAQEKVYIDRDLAELFYKEAIDEYRVVAEKSTDAFLTGRANFGLAQASEGMGDREQAITFYRKVIQNKAMAPELIAESSKRAAWLESKAGEEFYAWYKTSRASSPVLQESTPASSLPSMPDISFPKATNAIPSPDGVEAPAVTPIPPVQPAPDKPADARIPAVELTTPKVPIEQASPVIPIKEVPTAVLPNVDDAPAEKKPQS